MLTDKQIEREEAFCEDWYMTRKMGKTPTYADAIAWADKTMIDKICNFIIAFNERAKLGIIEPLINVEIFRKAIEE